MHFQAVSILSALSPNISLNDIKKGLGHWPSFIVSFSSPFTLNIYTEFRKMRQWTPWKPVRLMKRTIFKNRYDLIT